MEDMRSFQWKKHVARICQCCQGKACGELCVSFSTFDTSYWQGFQGSSFSVSSVHWSYPEC